MKKGHDIIRGYVADQIAAHRHVLEAVTRHAEDPSLSRVAGAQAAVARAVSTLAAHLGMLDLRVEALGGQGPIGGLKEAVTSVTGYLTGLYGQVRGETAARMLRDDYTAINFLLVCATMLHTTARAFKDEQTASVTSTIMGDLPTLLLTLQNLVPEAVVVELAADHPEIDRRADTMAMMEIKAAWHASSAPAT